MPRITEAAALAALTEEQIFHAAAKILAKRRRLAGTGRGGRPRDLSKPRCPCGQNTLRRAAKLAFKCCRAAGIDRAALKHSFQTK